MSVKYRLIQKVNPRNLTQPKKYYANAVTGNQINLRELAKEIADISTLSPIDTFAAIEALIQLLPKHLARGSVIRLGDFGSFSLSISSDGADSEDDFKASMIRNTKIHFRPAKQLLNALSTVDFEKEQ